MDTGPCYHELGGRGTNMEKQELIKNLSELVHVDIDAFQAYKLAIKEIEESVMRERIESFKTDHHNHIKTLFEKIRSLGGRPPEYSLDFKGFVIEGLTALRSMTGLKGALKALAYTEEITNRYYGEFLSRDGLDPVKDILRRHLSDEKIHLDYFKNNRVLKLDMQPE